MIGWIIYVIKSIYTTLYIIFTSWTWDFVIFYITGMTLDLSSIEWKLTLAQSYGFLDLVTFVWFLFCKSLKNKNKNNQSIKLKIAGSKSLYD